MHALKLTDFDLVEACAQHLTHLLQSIKEYKKLNKSLQSEHLMGEMEEVTDELYSAE